MSHLLINWGIRGQRLESAWASAVAAVRWRGQGVERGRRLRQPPGWCGQRGRLDGSNLQISSGGGGGSGGSEGGVGPRVVQALEQMTRADGCELRRKVILAETADATEVGPQCALTD